MIKICIVDDHNIVRDGLRAILQKEDGFMISDEAQNYAELMKIIRLNVPDVVLLDISLPDKNGIEIASELKALYPDIKILMLSMYISEEFVINAVNVGVDAYLPKNTTRKELITAIRKIYDNEYYFPPEINKIILNNFLGSSKKESVLNESNQTLSSREIEILKLYASGCSNKEISEKLFISPRTVESHKNHMMQKLDLKSPVELVKFAIKNKLVNL